jgi:hypothetical protein
MQKYNSDNIMKNTPCLSTESVAELNNHVFIAPSFTAGVYVKNKLLALAT